MSTGTPRADAAAQSVGASDAFVLRRVTGNRFVHLGGAGRGSGWAGLIEVTSDEEAPLRKALASRRPVRLAHGGRELVFGPYYARAAAFVPVTNDLVVVFGSSDGELDPTDDELTSAAQLAADAVDGVTEAKRLADELEELEAVRSALAIEARTLEEAMEAHARVAKESLSCELGAVYLEDGDRVQVVERGWRLHSPPRTSSARCGACSRRGASPRASRTPRSCRCRRRSTRSRASARTTRSS